MDELWQRIERALAGLDPSLPGNLRPGASEAAIQRAEKALALSFPADYRASLRLHEGTGELVDGWWLKPLAEVVSGYRDEKDFVDDGTTSLGDQSHVRVRGPVRPQLWNLAWIPVGRNGSANRLLLDLDPAPGGTSGQVVEQSREGTRASVLAPSLSAWLEGFAADLEAGRYRVDRDAGIAELRKR